MRVHSGKYDFFYLPMDHKNKCNLGYAFVNFTEMGAAASFYAARHLQPWSEFNSKKVHSFEREISRLHYNKRNVQKNGEASIDPVRYPTIG